MTPHLPPGLLPKWLLFVALISLSNSLQAHLTLPPTQRVYSNAPAQVTSLCARTFGTWTALSAIVRLYAAYNIHDPVVYQLALWTFVVAAAHFASEWLVFRTVRAGWGVLGPGLVAGWSLVWMLGWWGFYVG